MNTLSTNRLEFRTWTEDDLAFALKLWGDPEVMAFLGGALWREQIIVKLESEISSLQTHGIQYWPLFAKADGSFIGCCGLKLWTYSNHGSHELGFHLVKESWGKGYAPEASFAVIEFAKNLGVKHLRAGHHPHNLSSKKVLEKLGFEFFETKFFPPTGLMHPSYCLTLR